SDDFPGLQFRERPAFADADDVARPEFPVLIVRVVFLRASHCLPHHRMGETAFNLHDHGLGVLVAHPDALENALGHVLNPLPLPLRLARLLAHNRLDAGDLAPDRAYAARVLELSVRALETQVELFLFEFGERIRELVRRLRAQIVRRALFLCHRRHTSSRAMNLVPIESFEAPSRSASRAVSVSTPSTSKRIRPGLMRATQYSGAPLPEPMRTSAGFFDTGTSGKTRIHTRPARFICRVIARRAASISRAVMRSGSTAFRPNAPKLSDVPAFAAP